MEGYAGNYKEFKNQYQNKKGTYVKKRYKSDNNSR